jgi:hypothetical protein
MTPISFENWRPEALTHCNAFPHALLKIVRQMRFNSPSGELLSQFGI